MKNGIHIRKRFYFLAMLTFSNIAVDMNCLDVLFRIVRIFWYFRSNEPLTQPNKWTSTQR